MPVRVRRRLAREGFLHVVQTEHLYKFSTMWLWSCDDADAHPRGSLDCGVRRDLEDESSPCV